MEKSLIYAGKLNQKKRGRPSIEKPVKKITNHGLPLPEDDIRYDNLRHLPNIGSTRHIRKNNMCKSRIVTYCIKCNVYLCINQNRNCFVEFHSK